MKYDIRQTWHFDHPVERVWEFLTVPELLSQWLMENDISPEVGHQFMFSTKPRPGFDGNIFCEVLEVIPLKKLSYSWKGGPKKGKISLDSIVTWTLNPTEKGTELLLEHTGFRGMKNLMAYLSMNMGWGTKIKARLSQLLNNYEHEAKH